METIAVLSLVFIGVAVIALIDVYQEAGYYREDVPFLETSNKHIKPFMVAKHEHNYPRPSAKSKK